MKTPRSAEEIRQVVERIEAEQRRARPIVARLVTTISPEWDAEIPFAWRNVGFVQELNKELGDKRVHGLKRLRVVHIRASADIGALAGEYVRSPDFTGRASGMIGGVVRRISEWEGAGEADLLSYILFDGEFASRLIELGRNDARARHAELCNFFDELAPTPTSRPPSSSRLKASS